MKMVYSARDVVEELEKDPTFAGEVATNPVEAIRKRVGNPKQWDVWIYRLVVIFLGLTILSGIGGAIALSIFDKDLPEILLALGSAAVGALAGLLAPQPGKQEQ